MRSGVTIVAAFILVAAAVSAQSDFDRTWPALVEQLDRTHVAGDLQGLMDVRADCRQLLDEPLSERQRRQVHYAIAYADWRLLGHPDMLDNEDRDELGDEAVELLRANVAADDTDVESQALLGGILGIQITSAWRAMRLGRRASAALDAARTLDERNPRFLLLKGIEMFHRPGMLGGGAEDAEPWFRSAAGFFEVQPPDQPWPDWGRADAYAWLGRTLARLGDAAGAREQYEKALDVEPDYAWVRDVLLPRLDDEE